jgi:isoleucyl-tRNA synthetase
MEYNFREIEQKWQAEWKKNGTYKTVVNAGKPKFYVLDMFPYPSGAGLHVGHPLGYIASDIFFPLISKSLYNLHENFRKNYNPVICDSILYRITSVFMC